MIQSSRHTVISKETVAILDNTVGRSDNYGRASLISPCNGLVLDILYMQLNVIQYQYIRTELDILFKLDTYGN